MNSKEFKKDLNVFLSRLLFCFFAEDAEIFEENLFSNSISCHTQENGSDFSIYLERLFQVLNTKENERINIPDYLNKFPYVNGGLFAVTHKTPKLSGSIRKAIIEAGTLDWANINPDIFGSMFQAVNYADSRGTLGQHFTSVPNIMKVIEPLFLNDLKEEFENSRGNNKKLSQLLNRLKNIKIFDPACGSGNFLIIAYKELRRLEMEIFKEMGSLALSEISLSQFYGVEIDEFAKEIAILALWLSKHQMNVEFFKAFGRTNPTLPLTETGNIFCDNACRVDWKQICPKGEKDEIYILGNPPYLGYSRQNEAQKKDVSLTFGEYNNFKKIDYIGCWFYNSSKYIFGVSNSRFAFVSTNSITQGEQVSLLWPLIYNYNLEIGFAYNSFKWDNNAKGNAGVSVVIIGIQNIQKNKKFLINGSLKQKVNKINSYLISREEVIVKSRTYPLSKLPTLLKGSMPNDGGNLILSENDFDDFKNKYPNSIKYIRKFIGAQEFINDKKRYCFWITDSNFEDSYKNPEIKRRIECVRKLRESSKRKATQALSKKPYLFGEVRHKESNSIIIPRHTSENRKYIPIGFLSSDIIVSDSALVLYEAHAWMFSILTSKMHQIWIRIIGGKLETRIRYSSSLVYNTFPFPNISKQRKEELTQSALNVIDERLKHSEKTIAELYDPDKMPEGLREAHHQNDLAVERCYRSNPFSSDEERLEYLFKLYETMIQEEKDSGTLFAKEKKTRKRR